MADKDSYWKGYWRGYYLGRSKGRFQGVISAALVVSGLIVVLAALRILNG